MIGRILRGQYRIEKLIGRGGMGSVYRATQLSLNRAVAIKILAPELLFQPQHALRFVAEAEIAAGLQSPHIVQVYDAGKEGDLCYIVMELCIGVPLDRLVCGGNALPQDVAVEAVVHAAKGLAAAHAKQIYHRDIKPANLMVVGEHVKIMDFGVAKADVSLQGLTQPGQLLGTPVYMSPESYEGGVVDGQSDIYSLGLTLFELLTGRLAYTGRNHGEILFSKLRDPVPSPRSVVPDISEGLCRVVGRMSACAKEERYRTIQEVLTELEPMLKPGSLGQVPRIWAAIGGPSTPLPESNPAADSPQFGQLRAAAETLALAPGLAAGDPATLRIPPADLPQAPPRARPRRVAYSRADLHLHTDRSDGELAPRALVHLAKKRGLELMAVTDHDTVEGLPEARRAA